MEPAAAARCIFMAAAAVYRPLDPFFIPAVAALKLIYLLMQNVFLLI